MSLNSTCPSVPGLVSAPLEFPLSLTTFTSQYRLDVSPLLLLSYLCNHSNRSLNELHLIAQGMNITLTHFVCGMRRQGQYPRSRGRLRVVIAMGAEAYGSSREWSYSNTLHFIKFLLGHFSFHEISSSSP